MSEMIERVAKAIHVLRNSTREMQARAAIKAMRNPTAAMIEAEPEGEGVFDKTNSAAHARAFWQAMIDESLNEERLK